MRLFQKSDSEKLENSKIVEGIRHNNIPWFVRKGADALHNVDFHDGSQPVTIATRNVGYLRIIHEL